MGFLSCRTFSAEKEGKVNVTTFRGAIGDPYISVAFLSDIVNAPSIRDILEYALSTLAAIRVSSTATPVESI